MSTLRISDAPLLPDVDGTEKIPTGGKGDYAVSLDQVKTFARGGLPQQLEDHINDTSNPHQVTKDQVGLGNADNTSDIDKPISDATQEALDLKANQSTTYTKTEVDGSLSLKADKSYVDSQDLLKADKTYVDNALSGFTNGASKFYPTLALAEADIANITVKDKVDIGEVTNGGTWYKATTGATSLTKSPYDPLTQAKADATTKANAAEANAKTYADTNKLDLSKITYSYVEGNMIGSKTPRYTNLGLSSLFAISAAIYYDSAVLRVKEGNVLFLLNDQQQYNPSNGAGFAFFAEDPNVNRSQSRITDNRVSVTDSATSLVHQKVTVPTGAKYLMLNTRFTNAAGTVNTTFNWAVHADAFSSSYTPGVEIVSEILDSALLTKIDINKAKAEVLQQSEQYTDEKINIESSFSGGNYIKNTGLFYNGIGVTVSGMIVSANFSAGVVPVESGELLYVFNTANNFSAGAGYGLIFLAENPNTNRSQSAIAYTSVTATDSESEITYRKITVPENAKFVMVNTRWNELQITWAIHKNKFSPSYEMGVESIEKINGLNIGTPAPILPIEHLLGSSYRFYGKKVFCSGDSITQGTEGGYVQYISQILGCEVLNYGSSGSTAKRLVDIVVAGSGIPRRDALTTEWVTKDYTQCSAVTIQIGTNDYHSGSISDIPTTNLSDYANPLDYWALFPSNYVANIALCIEYIRSKNSECEIFLITPPYRNVSGDTPSRMANCLPFLRLLSEHYSIPLINSMQESGIGFKYMKSGIKYSYDGIHFNALGNKLWGKYIARKILAAG